MATYGIDDAHGNPITTGLPRQTARKTAQRIADERDVAVWLYRESEGAQAFESEAFEPVATKSTEIRNAKLGWDDRDPRNTGWWLSYVDQDGTEQGISIEAEDDASLADLAEALTNEPDWVATGTVKVLRRDVPIGAIAVQDGVAAKAVR